MPKQADTPNRPRRDFVIYAAGAVVGVGGLAALWPLVHQGNPNPGTERPEQATVDLATIAPGKSISLAWGRQPVIVRHRIETEIARARLIDTSTLRDRLARNANLPAGELATDAARSLPGRPEWLVLIGTCSHDACIVRPRHADDKDAETPAFFCPCDASRFDDVGRVMSGPAGRNLAVPPCKLQGRSILIIG
jgi:ubiquinol-cytochrome c reductase iron-sulfur subunit